MICFPLPGPISISLVFPTPKFYPLFLKPEPGSDPLFPQFPPLAHSVLPQILSVSLPNPTLCPSIIFCLLCHHLCPSHQLYSQTAQLASESEMLLLLTPFLTVPLMPLKNINQNIIFPVNLLNLPAALRAHSGFFAWLKQPQILDPLPTF